MSIFQPTYKDKTGKPKKVSKWWIVVRDRIKIRRFAGFTDKKKTQRFEENVKKLIDYRKEHGDGEEILDWDLRKWLENDVPLTLQTKLVSFGLLKKRRVSEAKPLADYLDGFEQTVKLHAEKKHSKQAKLTAVRVKKIIDGCGFIRWLDIDGGKVDLYVHQLQDDGMQKQTAQFYVKAFRQFAQWIVAQGYGKQYWPLKEDKGVKQGIRSVKVKMSIERYFETDEYTRLLEAARTGPTLYGLTGYQRYLLYQLAVETGLRRNELRSITPASFNFTKRTVFVRGADTKNGDDAEQEISPELATLLEDYTRTMMPNVQLFNIHDKSAKMVEADCEAAGVTIRTVKGKIKFHTLRHTCATLLIHYGANLKIVQEVMRHKSIDITISRYGHLIKGEKKSAVARLGKLSIQHAATGTE